MPKIHKHLLLFDEGMPPRKLLYRCNNFHNVRHVRDDFNLSGSPDSEIFRFAQKESRTIVTLNYRDYYQLQHPDSKIGVIGISTKVSLERIDKKLLSILKKTSPAKIKGNVVYIS